MHGFADRPRSVRRHTLIQNGRNAGHLGESIDPTKTGNVKVAVQNIVQGQRNKNSGHLGFNEKTEIYDPNSDGPDL